MRRNGIILTLAFAAGCVVAFASQLLADQGTRKPSPAKSAPAKVAPAKQAPVARTAAAPATPSPAKETPLVGPGDWNQWGGSPSRNNAPETSGIPSEWNIGKFDKKTGDWDRESSENIKWVARLGSQSYGNPVIANGKVYVGTNNGAGYLKRYAASVDLGCLLAFNDADGAFLWQDSNEKLPTGFVNDWPLMGICCAPYIEGNRGWFVTSRGEVVCFDVEGFHDGENDGPFKAEPNNNTDEADRIWVLDMMKTLGVFQHNMCSCSITATGDILWICTSNGVDNSHVNLPAPVAPSFIAVDKNSGKVLWKDDSPGLNILHGQWSSPAYAVIEGVPQVIFAGGDAWIYSFRADAGKDGKAELLWKFDANPKESKYILGGAGTRNEIIATPVVYNGLVYLAVGQDPEHGDGIGHLWCIDPKKRGDISGELAFNVKDLTKPIAHKRIQAVNAEEGEVARPNPNSGVVWRYDNFDFNGDGEIAFEETMHRTCGTASIKNDILYLPDFSGLFHCVDAKTGKPYYTHDLFAACWGTALVADGKVYVGDEEGKVTIFKEGTEKDIIAEIDMGNSVYSTPVVANNVLYIMNKTHLFAISEGGK